MSEKIEETLRKIAAATSKASSPSSSNTEQRQTTQDTNDRDRSQNDQETPPPTQDLLGDVNCPYCHGLGYLRPDVPLGHPDFGKVEVCICRQQDVSQQVRQRLYSLSHLVELKHLTFENFKPRGRIGLGPAQADSLERAYNSAFQFARRLEGWLLLRGRFGCGKTHLAAAIANFAVEMGVPTLFITVPDLLDSLRFSYRDPDSSFEERFDEIRQAPLLVLDDFGTQNATAWAQEKLFQILNYRYINRLPLVITTNLALEEMEGRILSRIQDPELVSVVNIMAPDYRRPADDTGHPELSSLDLFNDATFATFSLRQGENIPIEDLHSLEHAFQAARDFAENPVGWLVLMGVPGCGKTHLAAAIGNYRAAQGFPPLMVVVPDLLDHLRATFNPDSTVKYDRRFEEIRRSMLLILDDLGTESATPWAKEKLYQLLNYRYNARLATVITMTQHLEEFYQVEPRIASRMLDKRLCTICAITAPGFRGGADVGKKTPSRKGRKYAK